ncbi:TPA: EscU/YscU/HrcU family type III secretion system export apparatus switch protein [Vibrio vulnificus]|nr:EscU/YscU/HrcU family type III secretion system export apparatus switch protein [Vibrio vulnificus]
MTEEKTENATSYKLKQAKEKGQVFKSQDMLAIGSGVVLLLTVVFFIEKAGQAAALFMRSAISSASSVSKEHILDLVPNLFSTYLTALLPVASCSIIIAVVLSILQTRGVFSFYPLQPNIAKLNPIKGFKKIFSLKSLFELVKGLIRIAVVAYIVYEITYDEMVYLPDSVGISLMESMTAYTSLLVKTIIFIMLSMLPFAFIDFSFQRWSFHKEMRMTKKEVKDEYKKQEGDPEIKFKRKLMQKEIREKSGSLTNVSDADIVVTNPTFVAVALRYDDKQMNAPKIVAKGKGKLAHKIRTIAAENKVVMKTDIALARALYKNVDINREITPEFYDDVAELYRWFYKISH